MNNMSKTGRVDAVSISERKGVPKSPQAEINLLPGHGVNNDAHAGAWHRQVSLLASESIARMKQLGLEVGAGSFAENIATSGIVLHQLPLGSVLRIGGAVLRVTQIGKECHDRCAIYHQAGDCVMPREGIFAEVITGGIVRPGDQIQVWPARRGVAISLSDKAWRGEREDVGGPLLIRWLQERGFAVDYFLLPDEQPEISACLRQACDELQADLVVTTGGTGFSTRDVTPEATSDVLERRADSLAEGLRYYGLQKTPRAMLSRGVAGLRGHSLIINLPGSPKALAEYLEVLDQILPHALQVAADEAVECATGL